MTDLSSAAVAATWAGGVWFLALMVAASIVLAFEWAAMSAPHAPEARSPASGGIAVASALGILANFDLPSMPPSDLDADGGRPDPAAVHLVTEAERLAYADRDKYVADPDFVPLPGRGVATILDPAYLRSRAALISPDSSLGEAPAGDLGPVPLGSHPGTEHGTSHITVADKYGNVASMTTTSASGTETLCEALVRTSWTICSSGLIGSRE